jgi:ABC-type antimicrobial peptide transport system permease subunit
VQLYVPVAQSPLSVANVLVRSGSNARSLAPSIERIVRDIGQQASFTAVQSLDSIVGRSSQRQRLLAKVLTAFAAVALFLAAIGMYGVMACAVAQRRREIGIRLALGARTSQTVGLIVLEGLQPVMLGVVCGLLLAILASPVIANQLFGVTTHDGLTLTLIPLILVTVGFLANAVPAVRASRVEPIVVLRDG